MTTSVSQQIPPPKNWQDFESLCADLWTRIWNDPDTQMHGRQGQAQHGIDVYGRPNQGQHYAGVQCKGKDVYNNKEVSESELSGEVEKAKKFRPLINHFILATTAPNDVKIQAIARKITEQHKTKGLFDVVVVGWEEIQRRLTDYPELLDKFYPGISPVQHKTYNAVERVEASLVAQGERSEQRHQEVLAAINKMFDVTRVGVLEVADSKLDNKIDEALNAEIDGYRDLLNTHQITTSLLLLEKLKSRVWNEASENIKFRITTNIAAAKSRVGRVEEAAREFLNAVKYNPTDEKAICNVAYGYLLIHEYEKAYQAAKKAIEEHPECSRAYSLLVASLEKDLTVDDPTVLIPQDHLEKEEVAYTLSHFFSVRNEGVKANEWIQKALNGDGNSIEVRAAAGTSILESLLADTFIVYSGQINEEQNREIEKARCLLESSWCEIKNTDEAIAYIHIATNLANLERLTRNFERAREIVDESLAVCPDETELIKLKIIIALQMENYEEALLASEKVEISHLKDIIMMQAEALYELDRHDEALEKLNIVTNHEENNFRDDAIALKLLITRKREGVDSAIMQAQKLLNESPENIRVAGVLCGFYREKKDNENISIILGLIKSLITEKSDYRDKRLAADAFFYSGNYQDATHIYESLIKEYRDTEELRHLLICLMELDKRHKILAILEQLDGATSKLPFYLKISGAIFQRIGNIEAARNAYSKYLEKHPDDLNVRLAWIEANEKIEDKNAIELYLDEVGNDCNSDPQNIIRLAHILVDYGRVEKGLLLAYENRRKHFDNPVAHYGYMGLLLFKTEQTVILEEALQVAVDTAFILQDKVGKKSTYVIESNENRNRQIGELSPKDLISVNAIGKKVGEDVIVSETHLQNDVRQVVSVKNKYLHALHDSMERFQELFPEHRETIKISLEDSPDPNEKFAPIFKSVSNRQDHILQVEELYVTNRLPLAVVATFTGTHPIDVWRSFVGRQKTSLNVCVGTSDERNKAFEIIEKESSLYVIDPITLFTICILEIQNQVVSITGKLSITQSTLDLLQQLVNERKVNIEGYLTLSKEGDQLYKQEVTKEDIERDIAEIQSVLSWAKKNCEILPAVGDSDLPLTGLELNELMAPAFTDTILAAQGSKRVLLADDMHYRMIASELVDVEGVWLQPILMVALKRQKITNDLYHESIIKMVNSNYNFISIDANLLIYLAEKQSWNANSDFQRVASTLNGKFSDFTSSLKVSIEFLIRMWNEPIWFLHKEKFVYMLLNILTKDNWDKLDEIIALMLISVDRIVLGSRLIYKSNQNLYRNAILKWCQGHFIFLNE